MTPYELGKTIRKHRKEAHLTQAVVAAQAGISRPTLSKIEQGLLANVSIRALFLILDTMNLELDVVSQKSFGLPVLKSID